MATPKLKPASAPAASPRLLRPSGAAPAAAPKLKSATGKTITYIGQPKVSVSNAAKGVKISWGAIAGAEKYRVYVKTASGWTNIGNTTGTSLTYTKAVSGETYTFTVRARNADDTEFLTKYNTTGWTYTYSAAV